MGEAAAEDASSQGADCKKTPKRNYHDICLNRAATLRWFAKHLGKRYLPIEGVMDVISLD